jgi:hypothetical protein
MRRFENAEQKTKEDVVAIRLIKDWKHRSLSFGEGDGE